MLLAPGNDQPPASPGAFLCQRAGKKGQGIAGMETYLVRVLTDSRVGEAKRRPVVPWVACAQNADQAMNIVAGRIPKGHQVEGVNKAPGTAEYYKLGQGQARAL